MNKAIWITGLISGLTLGAQAGKVQPNVILMMADDMGWGDTGFNGNKIIQTPNLDHMAKDGAVLNHFYSIGPVCSPTRASFLTGRHYYRSGIWTANVGHLPQEEFSIARMLKGAGYATGHFGKWHLGTLNKTISAKGKGRKPAINFAPPWERDYDASFVTESAICTWDPGEGNRSVDNPYYENGVVASENLKGDDSRVLMDRTIPFIQQAVQSDTPFVAVVWFHAPHEDIKAGPDYLKMYEQYGDLAHYYGCITALDDQVGRLRAELNRLGVADNTALFFCSDNGPEGGKVAGRRGGTTGEFSGRKRSVLDGGVRVPALAVWPGEIEAGSFIDVPMSVLDYLPTVSAITGAKLDTEHTLDGEDIMPILKGKTQVHSKSIPFRFNQYACLVKGKYKLIIEHPTDHSMDRLFDLETDKTESTNVVSQYPEMVQKMRNEILSFLASAKASHAGAEYNTAGYQPTDPWQALGKYKAKKKKPAVK